MTAPVPVCCIYFAKLAIILAITLLTQLWTGILYLICGKIAGLPGLFPPDIFLWLLRGTVGTLPICALQLFLSMKIRSFSIPIAVGLVGSVLGTVLNSEGAGFFWPYCLMLLGMNANKSENAMSGELLPFLISVCLFTIVFSTASIWELKHRDIHT